MAGDLAQVAEAFGSEVAERSANLALITDAYWSLQAGGDPYVSLADVQAKTGLDPKTMGEALRYGAANDRNLSLDPEVAPSRLTPRAKAAAVRANGELNHYMSLDLSQRPASAGPRREAPKAGEPVPVVKPAAQPKAEPAPAPKAEPKPKAEPAPKAEPKPAKPAATAPRKAARSTTAPASESRGDMPASTTSQAAAGKKPIITWPKPATSEINGNVSSAAYCNDAAFQFHQAAAYAEAMAAAVVNDMTEFLRENGLDGQRSVGPISYGSDARSAARKAAKPLRNIAADLENIAKHFQVLKRLLDQHVWDPVQQAQAEQERAKRSAAIRIGA